MSASRPSRPPDPPLLAVRGVSVAYGGAQALRAVTLEVEAGALVAVVGATGAGKTTLLRAIAGLLGFHRGRIVSGAIELDGRTTAADDAAGMVRRGVAQVLEGGRVFPGLTVDENLRVGALGRHHRGTAVAARDGVLALFPALTALGRTPAGRLSGGERQMLAIGRSLMSSPRLLLLDEPFLGLAPRLVEQLQEFLVGMNARGTTVVIAEQSAEAALTVAHRAYVLAEGRVVAEGPASELAYHDLGRLYLGAELPPPEPPPSPQQVPVAAPPLLELSGVVLRFGPVTALDGLTMHVAGGEIVAVIGPNGAGKTSVLNCVNRLYHPGQGCVRVGGVDLAGLRPWDVAGLGVARSFQRPALFEQLDVVENLLVGRHRLMTGGLFAGALRLGRSRQEEAGHRRRCEEIVDLLELGAYRARAAGELPYGVQKVVELGRALAMEARLVLLDEPSAGLSAEEADHLARCILRLRREQGLAVLMVEHHVSLVARLADRVVVLDSGRLVADGPPAEVLANPEVARVYLGQRDAPRHRPEAAAL